MDALLGGASVMRNVYVPTAVFPLAAVSANVGNLALCIAVLPLALGVFDAGGGLRPVPLVVGLASLIAFTAGVALMLSALNLFFRDVRYFFEALLLVWFYATPIVYPRAALPDDARLLVALNPLTWIVESLRAGLCDATRPEPVTLVVALLCGSVSLVVGWRVYVSVEDRFHLYW
jgi:ABC-type polysaccharide/polyol phosphate export permease